MINNCIDNANDPIEIIKNHWRRVGRGEWERENN